MYKTIKVTKEVHMELVRFISKIQLDNGERMTMDKAIESLLQNRIKEKSPIQGIQKD